MHEFEAVCRLNKLVEDPTRLEAQQRLLHCFDTLEKCHRTLTPAAGRLSHQTSETVKEGTKHN